MQDLSSSGQLILPPADHPAHTFADVDIVRRAQDFKAGQDTVPTLLAGRKQAIARLKAEPAIRHVHAVILRANDDRELVRFGARGGHRTIWNFTTGKTASRVG